MEVENQEGQGPLWAVVPLMMMMMMMMMKYTSAFLVNSCGNIQ
jgi:hypothetical protein